MLGSTETPMNLLDRGELHLWLQRSCWNVEAHIETRYDACPFLKWDQVDTQHTETIWFNCIIQVYQNLKP